MYRDHWQLREKPFENTPDPRFLFHSAQHEEAYVRMLYVVRERKGAGLLTGAFGCGKTLLSRALMGELSTEKYQTVYVANPRLNDLDFLRIIGHQLGLYPLSVMKSDLLIGIENALTNNLHNGKDTVILVDEAHAILDDDVFEEVRLLLNYQQADRFLLTLLLVGQPELTARVNAIKQLEQRIAMKCHLDGFTLEETRTYITYRLAVAGAARPLFTPEAVAVIHEHTGGIPRRINRLCDVCLLAGFIARVTVVTPALVTEELHTLGGEG